jgi:hypothetical protein
MIAHMLAHLRGSLKSWTIWLNGVGLTILAFADNLSSALPIVREYIPQQAYSILGGVLALNILLRFKTNKSLAHK